jgi:hypothetical protein
MEIAMSLYNAMFGTNPFASILLQVAGVMYADVPRFRDCFLSEDGNEVVIHTRTGGGNREAYAEENDAMTKVATYLRDEDDDFDSTYANFHYAVPEAFKSQIALLKELGAVTNPAERWQSLLSDLRKGDTSTPETARALALGEQIMAQITTALKGNPNGQD